MLNCLWHVREKEVSRVGSKIESLSDCKDIFVISGGFEEACFWETTGVQFGICLSLK